MADRFAPFGDRIVRGDVWEVSESATLGVPPAVQATVASLVAIALTA